MGRYRETWCYFYDNILFSHKHTRTSIKAFCSLFHAYLSLSSVSKQVRKREKMPFSWVVSMFVIHSMVVGTMVLLVPFFVLIDTCKTAKTEDRECAQSTLWLCCIYIIHFKQL